MSAFAEPNNNVILEEDGDVVELWLEIPIYSKTLTQSRYFTYVVTMDNKLNIYSNDQLYDYVPGEPAPEPIGSTGISQSIRDITYYRTYGHGSNSKMYIFASIPYSGYVIYDVSDPEDPKELSVFRTDGSTVIMQSEIIRHGYNTYLLSLHYHSGIYIININDPANPVVEDIYRIEYTKNVDGIDRPQLLSVSGIAFDEYNDDYAYVVGFQNGYPYKDNFYVLDISNLLDIQIVKILETSGRSDGVQYRNRKVYIASSSGMHIVSVRNRWRPRLINTVTNEIGYVDSVTLSTNGNFAFTAVESPSGWNGGLNIYDISNSYDVELVLILFIVKNRMFRCITNMKIIGDARHWHMYPEV